MTSHELAHKMLKMPDSQVTVVVTTGKYNPMKGGYKSMPITFVDNGLYNHLNGRQELQTFIIVSKE